MARTLQTSASVDFGANAGRRLVMETDSDPTLVKTKGTSYVRVYPSSANAVVTPVMGGATKAATGVPEDVTDYISFSGSSSGGLRYFPTGAVAISDKRFFKSTPAVAYDAASNSLVLDKSEAHGIVKVTYRTYFDRYLVTHGDSPCAAANTQTQGEEAGDTATPATPTYDPAFLVAEADGWETSSMEVAGPPCSQAENGYANTIQFSDYDPVGIKIETDAIVPPGLYPQYFNASTVPMGFTLQPQTITIGTQAVSLYCGCRVRVYPKVGVTLYGVNCAVGAQVVGSGNKPVLQSLTFSGSQSVNLDYPPSGAVAITTASTNALSLFNENISVAFVGPGGWVNEVEWKSRNTYEVSQGARKVRDDEIVVVTSAGSNTIPCYTFAQAQYTSEYYLYDVLFNWDETLKWYAPAMVLAVAADGRIGHLQIEPPARKGVL